MLAGPDERLDHALSLTESAAKHRTASAGVHRRSPPALSGADDLLGGDPFQVVAGGREVRMPEVVLGSSDADVAAWPRRALLEQHSSGWALRDVLSHVLAGERQRAVLTCRESPVASSAKRCALDVRAHCWRFAGRGRPRGAAIAPTVGPGSGPLLTSAASGPPPADGACRFRRWRSLARRRPSVRAVIRTRTIPTGVAPARARFRARRRSASP